MQYSFEFEGIRRPACCRGCEAVAEAIIASGLSDYYHHRTAFAERGEGLVPDELADFEAYDAVDGQVSESIEADGPISESALILEGVTCAACVWLIEKRLSRQPGVVEASINFSTRRASVRWRSDQTRLSKLLRSVFEIGYSAYPYDPQKQQAVLEREGKEFLWRIGVAGLFGMQVMVIAVGLYVGLWSGIDATLRTFLEWVSAGLALPVVVYSAQPFYRAAIRDIRARRPGMDVPVSLGILGAYLASLWSTYAGTGTVFYESVCMFAGFLLVARYVEFLTRRHSVDASERMTHLAPQMAHQIVDDGSGDLKLVRAAMLQVGDRVLVKPGGTVPCDGRVSSGTSTVDESILTGESHPVLKQVGDEVIGGSLNLDHPLQLTVERVGQDSTLSTLTRLVERAQQEKPQWLGMADRAASVFVVAVLVLTALTAWYWWRQNDAHWLATALSVLVITCPCAFSLATPTAMAAAIGTLFRRGIVVTRAGAIEKLARANTFVFDKTGTLTSGDMQLVSEQIVGDLDRKAVHGIVVALERQSDHPIARALSALPVDDVPDVRNLRHHAALGVSGEWRGSLYHLGSSAYMHSLDQLGFDAGCDEDGDTRVYLADDKQILAVFDLRDETRAGAGELLRWLKPRLDRVCLFSGDQLSVVRTLARQLDIQDYQASMKPEQKLQALRELQQTGAVVAMVGDGVNDAPVLAGADVSLSVAGATQLAHASSDLLLMHHDLNIMRQAIELTKKTRSVIKQNIGWALAYNILSLPLAASGYIEPWQAALGMSISSLLVVMNSYRLRWVKGFS